jgi:S1-C subfamily serine protease
MSKRIVVGAGVVVGIVVVITVVLVLALSNKPLSPRPTQFTELVQISAKGVVHLRMDDHGHGSGFAVSPRLIVTAKHCVQGVTDFLMTTHTGCQIRSTRAISDKEHDVAFVWVDDLECANENHDHRIEYGGEHAVVLVPLRLGSIKDCRLGQTVYTVGSPFGAANFNAVSLGVISGVGRDWSEWGGGIGWSVAFTVDSPGAPGNSGGPAFTKDGVVRGVLVGALSPSHVCVMPCDLFIEDLPVVTLMFATDRYSREEVAVSYDPYYDHAEGDECY